MGAERDGAARSGESQVEGPGTPGTPIPTRGKEEYEKHSREYTKRRAQIRAENRPESEMEALFRENRELEIKFFAAEKYAGKVGAFEGAIYEAKGYIGPKSIASCSRAARPSAPCAAARSSESSVYIPVREGSCHS